jgi:competence protein ComEC
MTAGLVLVVAVSWSATDVLRYQNFAGDFSVLACDVGQGDALIVRDAGQIALIDVGPDDDKIDSCLRSASVSHIDLLILTHFDSDHVGGIRGALQNRSVGVAIVSGFEDDRPLVGVVERELSARNISVQPGRAGLRGALGQMQWSVLHPSSTVDERPNSNDASVVVALWNQTHSIVALGDLGAQAQQRLLRNAMAQLSDVRQKQLVLKVAHHGSSDQSEELMSYLKPDYAIFSVGDNDYGHPTNRALALAESSGATVLRTDEHGPIALHFDDGVEIFLGGKLST